MASLDAWLRRCQEARAGGSAIPSNTLFRRMTDDDAAFMCDPAHLFQGTGNVYLESCAPELTGLKSVTGLELAATVGIGLNELRLHFDSGAPPLTCNAEEVSALASMLKIRVIEALLERMFVGSDLKVEDPMAKLREFEAFYVLCAGPDGARMVLAPDSKNGRALVAAFTAMDALQLFVAARDGNLLHEELTSVQLSGRELFRHIQDSAEIEGVVFNPSGPGQPCALSSAVAAAVLGQ